MIVCLRCFKIIDDSDEKGLNPFLDARTINYIQCDSCWNRVSKFYGTSNKNQPERSKREDPEKGCGALNFTDKVER